MKKSFTSILFVILFSSFSAVASIHIGFDRFHYMNGIETNDRNVIFMFVHPSIQAFNYNSYKEFKESLLLTKGFDKDINTVGHAQVGWSCQLDSGYNSGASGFTGEASNQFSEMTKDSWGLSPLFASFHDGIVESEQNVVSDLYYWSKNSSGFYWIGVEVSKQDCQRLVDFHYDFTNFADMVFGFMEDPKKLEGGGCTCYAMALMTQADHFVSQISKMFRRSLKIPNDVLGNPKKGDLPARTTMPTFITDRKKKSVGRFSIISGRYSMNDDDHVKLSFYDPELFVYTFSKINSLAYPSYSRNREVVTYNKSKSKFEMQSILSPIDNYFQNLEDEVEKSFSSFEIERATIAKIKGVILKSN